MENEEHMAIKRTGEGANAPSSLVSAKRPAAAPKESAPSAPAPDRYGPSAAAPSQAQGPIKLAALFGDVGKLLDFKELDQPEKADPIADQVMAHAAFQREPGQALTPQDKSFLFAVARGDNPLA